MKTSETNYKYETYAQAVTAAVDGKQEAFRYLYEATYRDKYYIAWKYMGNESDAQDVLQDSYIKAWQSLAQLQEPEKFPNWLSLIVANTALNALRKKKELLFSALEKDEDDSFSLEQEDWRKEYQPEHAYTDKEVSELLQELMDTLSDEQRLCVLMYYVEEISVKEIAQMIGCSENTVKSRLNYGRKHLKHKAEELEKKGYTLYSVAPIPLLLYLLRTESRLIPISIPTLGSTNIAASTRKETTRNTSAKTLEGRMAATAAKTFGLSIGAKVAVALLTVAALSVSGIVASRLLRSDSPERAAVDRHSYLLACIEEAGDFYQAEWDETLFDDWNGDEIEDVVFYGDGQWEDKYGTIICVAGISENPYDEVSKFKTPYDDLSIYRIPTDDGLHLAYCYTSAFEKKDGNYPYQSSSIKSFADGKVQTEASGECIFSNPQHNAIDAHYVNYNVQGEVKDEIFTTITWNGEWYTGTYYVFYTADYWYGTGVLFREDEGPYAKKRP